MKRGSSVAGGPSVPWTPDTMTWAVMTASTPNSTASRNGTSSTESMRSR